MDNAEDVGQYTSLALDADDLPHIGYFDNANRALKYASFDGTDWTIETVDNTSDVGRFSSLALDGNDLPHISYFDLDNADLKYAHRDGGTWVIETIDSEGDVGRATSLAFDGDGLPHVSYTSGGGDTTLKYASGQLVNGSPDVEAGGPYSGDEGSPITLQATASDPDSDELSTEWSYTIESADTGATCIFADSSQVETTFTCTDDGSFTVTLEAGDGINPPVTATANVTISNADPTISDVTATISHAEVTITVDAADSGENDVLGYAFDCNNDGGYEVAPQPESSTTCPLNPQQEGAFTFGVRVADDDGGTATDTVTAIIATNLCASNHTGVVHYSNNCRGYETAVTILGPDDPVTVCASKHNGLLRSPASGVCAGHETTYLLPDDGPLSVCISTLTQVMRTVDDLGQCASHEFGRVIAATEIGELGPRRSR